MVQKHFALLSLVMIIILVALNTAANTFFWYISIYWYDMMMHTIGGVFLALFATALFFKHIISLNTLKTMIILLLFVFVIGLGWEFFEYTIQYLIKGSARLADVNDSISDLLCDIGGGIIGAFFVIVRKTRYNVSNE